MLGFKREYGWIKNTATALIYMGAIDLIQAQFTGQHLSDYLGTSNIHVFIKASPVVSDITAIMNGFLLRYLVGKIDEHRKEAEDFLNASPRQSTIVPVRRLDDL